jgi:hypothetical protein
MMGEVFGPKKEVMGSWEKLHEENIILYSSPDIISVITSIRRAMWVGHLACIREMLRAYNILVK